MLYKVRACFIEEKMEEFFRKLTDGSIESQSPDGMEIVSCMKSAKVTSPGIIEWFETCYCPTPLQHERATVYEHYLTDITTRTVDIEDDIEGNSFWSHLEQKRTILDRF